MSDSDEITSSDESSKFSDYFFSDENFLYTYFDYVFWSFIRILMKMNYVILSINPLWLKIPVLIFVENLHTTFLLIRSRLIISINLWKHFIRLNLYIYRSPNVYPDGEEIDKVSHLIFKSLLFSISYVLFYFIINLCIMYKLDIFLWSYFFDLN